MKTLSLGLSLYSAMESLQNLSHSNFQVNLPQFLSGNGGRVLFLFIFNIVFLLSIHSGGFGQGLQLKLPFLFSFEEEQNWPDLLKCIVRSFSKITFRLWEGEFEG